MEVKAGLPNSNSTHCGNYQVAVDDQYPYWVYGAQTNNTTIANFLSVAPSEPHPTRKHANDRCRGS